MNTALPRRQADRPLRDRRSGVWVGVVLGLCALVAAACAPPASDRSAPPTVLRIGAAVSLTGSAAAFGATQRNGILLAQDEINASHMLGSARLQVIVADDGSDRDHASALFQRFIDTNHVLAILGPTLSDTALVVDPMAQQAGVPVLAISNSASNITEIGEFIFRDCLTESQLAPQLVKAVRTRLGPRTAALLYSNSDPNRSGAQGFKASLEKANVQIVSEQVFDVDQPDFSPQIQEIAASRPDAVFIAAPMHLAASIIVQARQHGLEGVPLVGTNAFSSASVLRSAGAAAEGLIVGSTWSSVNPSPRNQQFIQSYRARYGIEPDQLAAEAYSGVYIVANALRDSAATQDRRSLRDALQRISGLDTPLGNFSFGPGGDAKYPAIIQSVHNGQFQLF